MRLRATTALGAGIVTLVLHAAVEPQNAADARMGIPWAALPSCRGAVRAS